MSFEAVALTVERGKTLTSERATALVGIRAHLFTDGKRVFGRVSFGSILVSRLLGARYISNGSARENTEDSGELYMP